VVSWPAKREAGGDGLPGGLDAVHDGHAESISHVLGQWNGEFDDAGALPLPRLDVVLGGRGSCESVADEFVGSTRDANHGCSPQAQRGVVRMPRLSPS